MCIEVSNTAWVGVGGDEKGMKEEGRGGEKCTNNATAVA